VEDFEKQQLGLAVFQNKNDNDSNEPKLAVGKLPFGKMEVAGIVGAWLRVCMHMCACRVCPRKNVFFYQKTYIVQKGWYSLFPRYEQFPCMPSYQLL
jgi:hypothetical protein